MKRSKKSEPVENFFDNEDPELFEDEMLDLPPLKKEEISWKASEYIHHEKSTSWYFGLVGAAILIGVIIVLVTQNSGAFSVFTSIAVLIVMTAALIVFAGRKPETLSYRLDLDSLDIGPRHFFLDDFRSFSMVQDGGVVSVVLSPLKRFMPPVSLYFDPKDEESIVAILARRLPHEETELDFVDRLIRKLRF